MELQEILRRVDHTLLKPDCTRAQILALCDEALRFQVASVCIPPSYVRTAAEYLQGRVPVCTVIGFPNGYATTAVKAAELSAALEDGAAEVDLVINLGWVKDGLWDELLQELCSLRALCPGKIMKVIIETCLLTREEKLALCGLVSRSGADFIKTSTGFSTGGATPEDVRLLREHVAPTVRVKAAGGIASLADAEALLCAGAERLGTSRIIRLLAD